MRLRTLEIQTLPGIEPGFVFHAPDARAVLVTGPNAIGKSSLARALHYLLGGVRKSDPKALSLQAAFDGTAGRWTVVRNGSDIVWRCDGEVASPPALPSADQLGRYRLSMESLLAAAADDGDRQLAERLQRELRGGFDLDAARPDYSPGKAQTAKRKLQQLRRERQAIENGYRELRAQEQRLPALERRIADARDAERHCRAIDAALKLHDALRERRAAQAAFERFPPDMAKLRGDELRKLEQFDAKTREQSEKRRQEQRLLDTAQAELEATGLADSAPGDECIGRLERILKALDEKALRREHLARERDKAQAALREATAQFNADDRQPALTPDAFRQAEALIDPLLGEQQTMRELGAAIAPDADAPEAWRLEQLDKAADALRDWLAADAAGRHGQADAQARKRSWQASLAAAALAGIAALAALVTGSPAPLVFALLALVATLLSLASQRRARRESGAIDKPQADARQRFDATGEEQPPEWREQAVRAHLRRKIEEPLAQFRLRQQEAAAAKAKRRDIEQKKHASQQRLEELKTQKAELAERLGFDPQLPIAGIRHFIKVADDWRRARRDCEQCVEELRTLDAGIEADAEQARKLLQPWRRGDDAPLADAADAALLRSAWDALRQRLGQAREARRRLDARRQAVAAAAGELAGVQESRQALFAEACLAPDARAELAERLEQLDDWRAARKTLDRARHEEALAREALGENAALAALATDDAGRQELDRQRSEAGEQADALSDLLEARGALLERLDAAGRQHALEQARGAEDAARQALEEARAAALHREAADILLGSVRAAFRSEREPALLRRARERFAQTTAHAFALELRDADDANGFSAWDAQQEQSRSLDELSTGTRMQLLLAVRLAWIEEQERSGETLPVFLDEALAASDETRFAALAQSLARLAADSDRQMFLLSARSHDAALWRRATGGEPAAVDLAQVRFGIERPADDFALPPRPALPAPGNRDAASYAALLGVPPADPRRIAALHPFHLLRDDLDALHRLLDVWRIDSLGALQGLLASNAAHAAVGAERRERIAARCDAAQHWATLWRQGRGRPVDRGALESSGAVSGRFIGEAAELADRHAGDSAAIIEALRGKELKGFQTAKIDALESWLKENGYLDDGTPPTQQERHAGVLERLAPATPADAADIAATLGWLEAALPPP